MFKPIGQCRKKYWWVVGLGIFFIFLSKGALLFSLEIKPADYESVKQVEVSSTLFKLSVDTNIHDDYGLSYPVTYQFSIPVGSLNLEAYKRYSEDGVWAQISEKTSSDFFNGIEAVRFDYAQNKAYISVAFNGASDNIFLMIVDEFGNTVDATYDKVVKYYDNRDAAVVFSADDWCGNSMIDAKFRYACDIFIPRKIWLSVGVITQGFSNDRKWGNQPPPIWSHIQAQIDRGYIEVNSHSRTHTWTPYANYDSEVGGSKKDIINNLDLPPLYKSGTREYVWGWIAPYGCSDEEIRSKLGEYKYMSDISGPFDSREGDFPDWDPNNGLYENWNRWETRVEDLTLAELNAEFDKRINAGKIYHLGFHPWLLDLHWNGKLAKHADYVKGRKNLWYVGQGALMIYHYVEDQRIVTVQKYKENKFGEAFYYPNPCYPAEGQVVKIINLPSDIKRICIYDVAGELVRSLEKGGEIIDDASIITAIWDCRNDSGQEVARGTYIYLIITDSEEKIVGKIVIIR